jgi:hypothetical protein
MTHAGRVVQVQHVLTAMLVYLAMTIELPTWAIKAIDKIRSGFFLEGKKWRTLSYCMAQSLPVSGAWRVGDFRSKILSSCPKNKMAMAEKI